MSIPVEDKLDFLFLCLYNLHPILCFTPGFHNSSSVLYKVTRWFQNTSQVWALTCSQLSNNFFYFFIPLLFYFGREGR